MNEHLFLKMTVDDSETVVVRSAYRHNYYYLQPARAAQ
jgi:hypothetical protein